MYGCGSPLWNVVCMCVCAHHICTYMYIHVCTYLRLQNSILCAGHKGKVDLVGQISKSRKKIEGQRENREWEKENGREKKKAVISEVQRRQNEIALRPTAETGDGFKERPEGEKVLKGFRRGSLILSFFCQNAFPFRPLQGPP